MIHFVDPYRRAFKMIYLNFKKILTTSKVFEFMENYVTYQSEMCFRII
jgi:hypothetical protein